MRAEGLARRSLSTRPRVSNPGESSNRRFAALKKGQETRVPDEARTYRHAKIRVRNWDVLPLKHRTPFPPC